MTRTGRAGVGIIGAGNISTQYLTNLTTFGDVEVRFVADLDTDRAAAQAEAFGVPRSGTVAELLADDEIEVVVNLTVPAVHVEVAQQILAAGKHVWSEKPFALERESGRALLAEAQSAGLRVATAPDTFLGAGIQSALRLIAEGGIGQAHGALTLMQSPGPESWHPNPAFLFDIGAGPLFDIGPYYLTALVQFFGPVTRAQAVTSKARVERVIGSGPLAGQTFPVNVPTHVAALLEFESGQSAQSTFSFDSPLGRTQFEITGTDATLTVPDPNTFSGDLVLTRAKTDVETRPAQGSAAGRGTGVVELVRAIRAGVPERASGELAFHVLDVMQSIIEAGEGRQPVDVTSTVEVPPPLDVDWDPAETTLT
jgi:predicted dehydrogenase